MSNILPESLQQLIQAFNTELRSKPTYSIRKAVKSTTVLFADNFSHPAPPFRRSPYGWGTISHSLAEVLPHQVSINSVSRFSAAIEEPKLQNAQFMTEAKATSRIYLLKIATFLLMCHSELAEQLSPAISARVLSVIYHLKQSFNELSPDFPPSATIYHTIRKRLKEVIRSHSEKSAMNYSTLDQRNERLQHVLRLRREGILSTNEICEIYRISPRTFFNYLRMEKNHEVRFVKKPGPPPGIGHLSESDKLEVKTIVDDPQNSFSVPRICAELTLRLGRPFARSRVYTCLSKDLKYTFKRNSYIMPTFHNPGQIIVRYHVSKILLDAFLSDKLVLCMDEAGFILGQHYPYSYAPRGSRPYRTGSSKAVRINLTMAISRKGIYACQARLGESNEVSFCAFVCAIEEHILRTPGLDPRNVLLYLDNHSTHTSHLAMQLLQMLGIKVLFAPISFYNLNPIEAIFSLIKRRLWSLASSNMYLSNTIN